MKAFKIVAKRNKDIPARRASKDCLAAVLVVLLGMSAGLATGRAQQPENDVPGAQVLTRGPVHEAFAGIVAFNPEPGVVVTKAPPDVIEEVPPEERPEGDNVTWIPGYWAWDDERSDFLWVSGTWRALPPGRQWIAGYWGKTPQGYQWTSGYWADATVRETTYLPPPPVTVEVGPNIAAPSVDYVWTPGCWMWYQGRYAWRPGYWVQGRADWDWCPAHYVWTPRGHIFVGGFWDYPVEHRGIVFAPVYFESGVYLRRGYRYSPTIVIGVGVFTDHLFLRPSYSHYYFGDYYAASYHQGGFYASFSFQSSRYGYDPIYSHQRWEHRQDREWEHRVETSYQYRRDHETARPPRTWAAQRDINPRTAESPQRRGGVATPINQLAKSKDGPMRFQPVAREERQKLAQRGQEVQQSRDQRRTLEAQAVAPSARKPGAAFEPAKVTLPRSPIVAKPANQLGRNQAPPKAQQAPKPDPKFQPKSEPSGRQPNVDRPSPGRSGQQGDAGELQPGVGRSNPQTQPRKPEPTPTPGRSVAAPRDGQVQPESQPRVKDPGAKAREDSQRNASGLEVKAQQESERRAKEAAARAAEASQRNARGLEQKAQPETQPRAKSSGANAQAESHRVSEQPANHRPAPSEKGAAQLIKKDRDKEDKGKP